MPPSCPLLPLWPQWRNYRHAWLCHKPACLGAKQIPFRFCRFLKRPSMRALVGKAFAQFRHVGMFASYSERAVCGIMKLLYLLSVGKITKSRARSSGE